ncbi:phospholipase D-like domain-containing protein [Candidatus Odyssella thessalonicensis]|uniref:phospholipase D-like domain-containing protein n=1 Tax=Candidatus Odyssella thessalonicensis TaxID=84647 RepID=UPI000225B96D|nr:phospholipase D-like domain-containing protein [Candidatus Odyssella thessalonicensis]
MIKSDPSRYALGIILSILSYLPLSWATDNSSQSSQDSNQSELISTYYSSELAYQLKTPALSTEGKSQTPYPGFILKEKIENVSVESCVSLGGSCTQKVAEIIKRADEYVVSFMYRYNSPAITDALADVHLTAAQTPVLVFLDYKQFYEARDTYLGYNNYLVENVPTSLVKIGSKSFHHKIVIAKRYNEEATVIVGSANATYESDNIHSEDLTIIRSNKLAAIYLKEFYKMMNSQGVETYDINRKEVGLANLKTLKRLTEQTENSQEDDVQMAERDIPSFIGTITALAISSGTSSEGGNKACLNIFQNILKAKNDLLIFFENYFTMSTEDAPELENSTPKLIVLDHDSNNAKYLYHSLKEPSNHRFLFQLHTGGKFHHKLVIQYPTQGEPILYTGSFHPSVNAIKSNSENMIGIQSRGLADRYLSSILWQSGLGNVPEIWSFLRNFPEELGFKQNESSLAQIIDKLKNRAFQNIQRFWMNTLPVLEYFKMRSFSYDGEFLEDEIDLFEDEITTHIDSFKRGSISEAQIEELAYLAESLRRMVYMPIWASQARYNANYLIDNFNIPIDYFKWPFHPLSSKDNSLRKYFKKSPYIQDSQDSPSDDLSFLDLQMRTSNSVIIDLNEESMKTIYQQLEEKRDPSSLFFATKYHAFLWDYYLKEFGIYYDQTNLLLQLGDFIKSAEEALKVSLEDANQLREARDKLRGLKRIYEILDTASNYEGNFEKLAELYLTLSDITASSEEELEKQGAFYKRKIEESMPNSSKKENININKKRRLSAEDEDQKERRTKKEKRTQPLSLSRLVRRLKENKIPYTDMHKVCGVSRHYFNKYMVDDQQEEAQKCSQLLLEKYKKIL